MQQLPARQQPSPHVGTVSIPFVAKDRGPRRSEESDVRYNPLDMTHVPTSQVAGVIAECTAVRALRCKEKTGALKPATRDHVTAAPDTDSLPVQASALQMPDLRHAVVAHHL